MYTLPHYIPVEYLYKALMHVAFVRNKFIERARVRVKFAARARAVFFAAQCYFLFSRTPACVRIIRAYRRIDFIAADV